MTGFKLAYSAFGQTQKIVINIPFFVLWIFILCGGKIE